MKNEEILEKTLNKRLFDHLHTGSMKLTDKEILSAMDAARKDEAIAFAEWLFKSGYKFSHGGNNGQSIFMHESKGSIPFYELKDNDYKTTLELYQLFKSQDNK